MGAVEWCFAPCTLYAHIYASWPSVMNVWPYIVELDLFSIVDGVLLRITTPTTGVRH